MPLASASARPPGELVDGGPVQAGVAGDLGLGQGPAVQAAGQEPGQGGGGGGVVGEGGQGAAAPVGGQAGVIWSAGTYTVCTGCLVPGSPG